MPYHGYSPRGRKRYIGSNQIDASGFTFSKVQVLKFNALSEDERHRQTLLEWEMPRCCHCPFHCPPHGSTQQEHPTPRGSGRDGGTANDGSREVRRRHSCGLLEDDLIAIFRLTSREIHLWRKFPEFIPFPPLPMLDRQIRVSGCVVAWFLAQDAGEYHRAFKSPLEELTKSKRARSRPPWWKLAPPHAERYWARALEGEEPTLGVDKLAAILRTNSSAIRRVAKVPDFPLPPAGLRPLRWTDGQIERLRWAPQDHSEYEQKARRMPRNQQGRR